MSSNESVSGDEAISGDMPDQPASPLSLQRAEPVATAVATAADEQPVLARADAAEQRRAA